ncbi:hypothetical protein T05_14991 [Trichinella murrelli]|uniref:Uncharacterized protein n=1 Tax=Trichinella murrelli TaxID=144512 RepID=A0A0V0UAI3_9BILA|nr:hypothetical protein T05_14991 [Trichinella murrelli]
MKTVMGMCNYSKLILALFVFSNVTFVRSAINQTNETSLFNSIRPYNEMEVTLEETEQNNKIKNIHETMDQQQSCLNDQAIKKILNLPGKSNGICRGEFREKPNEHDELLFKAKWIKKIARASTVMVLLGCLLYRALILIFRFNILKTYRKYVKIEI